MGPFKFATLGHLITAASYITILIDGVVRRDKVSRVQLKCDGTR